MTDKVHTEGQARLEALDVDGAGVAAAQRGAQLGVAVQVLRGPPGLQAEQRRHAHVHVPGLEQRARVAEQEGEQQRADVRAVHIRIRQQDHLR